MRKDWTAPVFSHFAGTGAMFLQQKKPRGGGSGKSFAATKDLSVTAREQFLEINYSQDTLMIQTIFRRDRDHL